jgi:hypothetical protein
MRLIPCTIVLTLAFSCPVIAQKWEIGGLGGYGWFQNSTVSNFTTSNPPASGTVGFPSRATIGVVFAEMLPHRQYSGRLFHHTHLPRPGIKGSVNVPEFAASL